MENEKSQMTHSEYTSEYKKAHYKRVSFEVKKEFFEEYLQPTVKAKRMSFNSYIKEAIEEKMEREDGYKREF